MILQGIAASDGVGLGKAVCVREEKLDYEAYQAVSKVMAGKLYKAYQPSVLRSIRNVITAAKETDIPVGMCGEAAAGPCLAPLLMTWGLDEFSVSISSVLDTRANIRQWRGEKAKRVTQEAMSLSTASGVEGYLSAAVSG